MMTATLTYPPTFFSQCPENDRPCREALKKRQEKTVSLDSQQLVDDYYQPLYRFAYSLAKNEPDAVDLVQQTFLRWGQKGHTLRDTSKVKSWLFTTLHREFLGGRRRITKFPNIDIEAVEHELPTIESNTVNEMDASMVVDALQQVDEKFRSALSLFFLKELPYKEIADVLDVPIGTVMSRISRGKAQLKSVLAKAIAEASA